MEWPEIRFCRVAGSFLYERNVFFNSADAAKQTYLVFLLSYGVIVSQFPGGILPFPKG